VPKKRGPKTDVLEALLKRVDGLEKRLKTEEKSPVETLASDPTSGVKTEGEGFKTTPSLHTPLPEVPSTASSGATNGNTNGLSAAEASSYAKLQIPASDIAATSGAQSPSLYSDILLNTYFARIHGKPFHIVDEASIRQRVRNNQLPNHLLLSIYSLSTRFVIACSFQVLLLTSIDTYRSLEATTMPSKRVSSTQSELDKSSTLTILR
jgi:hypothetical protein